MVGVEGLDSTNIIWVGRNSFGPKKDNPVDTSITLLGRVLNGDQAAREEFAQRYVLVLRRWCRTWHVPESDADDLVQETLILVLTQLRKFDHRGVGSLRAWMRRIARRCWYSLRVRAERQKNIVLQEAFRRSHQAMDSLISELDQLIDQDLLETSMAKVRTRVASTSWDAFRLMALEGWSGEETAAKLGLSIDAVYMAKCRVQRFISEELKRSTST